MPTNFRTPSTPESAIHYSTTSIYTKTIATAKSLPISKKNQSTSKFPPKVRPFNFNLSTQRHSHHFERFQHHTCSFVISTPKSSLRNPISTSIDLQLHTKYLQFELTFLNGTTSCLLPATLPAESIN